MVPGTFALVASTWGSDDQASACGGHLDRSDDDGQTWHAIPGTCTGQNLFAVQFLDAQHGFAAGGSPHHYAGSQLVYATTDGGRTWSRRFTSGTVGGGGSQFPDAFADVAFTSPTTGYALGGACVGGADGPCHGTLSVTSDGGRSWRDTGLEGVELSALGDDVALTREYGAGTLISADAGGHWRHDVTSTDLRLSDVSRSSQGMLAATNDGLVVSTDHGTSWSHTALALSGYHSQGLQLRSGGHGLVAEGNDFGRLAWSLDGGTTWVPAAGGPAAGEGAGDVRLDPADDRRALAYSSTSDCSTTVFASDDAGHSWAPVSMLPYGSGDYASVHSGYADHVAAFVGQCNQRSYLSVSRDDGRTWTTRPLDYGYDLVGAAVAGGSVWLTGQDTKGNRVVLVSDDTGASWTAYDLVDIAKPAYVSGGWPLALSRTEAVLWFGDGSLWLTRDAGASWHQEWPDLGQNP